MLVYLLTGTHIVVYCVKSSITSRLSAVIARCGDIYFIKICIPTCVILTFHSVIVIDFDFDFVYYFSYTYIFILQQSPFFNRHLNDDKSILYNGICTCTFKMLCSSNFVQNLSVKDFFHQDVILNF